MIPRRPSHCPACEGPLAGIRVGQPCPRCAHLVGAEIQIIRQVRWSATAMLVFGVVLFLASVKGKPIGGWHPSQLMTLSACILITWGVLTRPKRKAVIWRDGFVLTGREESPERFYWSRVRHVRFSTAANAIELITDEGRLLDSIAVDFFGSHRRADSFVRAARTWIARHGTSQDPVGL